MCICMANISVDLFGLRGGQNYLLQNLSTGTFLHEGCVFSVSRLNMENGVFAANFLLKQRVYYNDGHTQGKKARKLTLKISVPNKV